MKKFFLLCTISFAIACGTETEAETSGPAVQEPVEEETQIYLSSTIDILPEEGYVSGHIGSFEGIDTYAYRVNLTSEDIDIYAYHDEGQVMVRLSFIENIHNYMDHNTYHFTINKPNTNRFFAVGCQSDDIHGIWDFDSHALRGNMVIIPVNPDNWLLEYSLEWSNYEIHGHVVLMER